MFTARHEYECPLCKDITTHKTKRARICQGCKIELGESHQLRHIETYMTMGLDPSVYFARR